MTKDGTFRWIEVYARLGIDEGGVVTGTYGTLTDISDRRAAEVEREKSLSLAQATLESTIDAILVVDGEGNWIAFNKRFERMWNVPPELLLERQDRHAIHYAMSLLRDPEQFASKVNELMKHPDASSLDIVEFLDGRIIERYSRPQLMNGEPVGRVWSFRDITDRKHAEEELRSSKERYRLLFDFAPVGILLLNRFGNILEVNPAAVSILGSPSAAKTKAINVLRFPPLVEAGIAGEFQRCIATAESGEGEHPYITKWGKSIQMHLRYVPILDESQRVSLVHIIIDDLTERNAATEALHWNRSLLQLMTESSPLGFLVVDNRTDDILYFNHRFCEIWGIESLEARMRAGEMKNNDIIPYCLPVLVDVPAFAESCKPLQSEENRVVVEDEIPFVGNRTVRRYSTQIRGSDDEYMGRFYIFEDVSEHRRVLESLQKSEERFRQLAELFPETIFEADLHGRLTYANDHGKHQFGVTEEDIARGLDILDLVHAGDRDKVRARIAQRLAGRTADETENFLEYLALRMNGEVFDAMAYSAPIMSDGSMSGLRGFILDITHRKRAEEQVRGLLKEKELVLREVHHRIKNNMNTVRSLLALQASSLTDASAVVALKEAQDRVQSMMLLYDKLYRSGGFLVASAGEYLSTLVDQIAENLYVHPGIRIEKHFDSFTVGPKTLSALGMLVNELITNALKYAFPEGRNGTISINVTFEAGHVRLIVEDDGVGMTIPQGQQLPTGFGLQLVGLLAEQLDATVQTEVVNGTKWIMEFGV